MLSLIVSYSEPGKTNHVDYFEKLVMLHGYQLFCHHQISGQKRLAQAGRAFAFNVHVKSRAKIVKPQSSDAQKYFMPHIVSG